MNDLHTKKLIPTQEIKEKLETLLREFPYLKQPLKISSSYKGRGRPKKSDYEVINEPKWVGGACKFSLNK